MFPITPLCTSMFSMWLCIENITAPQSGFAAENIPRKPKSDLLEQFGIIVG